MNCSLRFILRTMSVPLRNQSFHNMLIQRPSRSNFIFQMFFARLFACAASQRILLSIVQNGLVGWRWITVQKILLFFGLTCN